MKDENGRRRFHGAFTGGFSAGYWNTVGSEEGFKPREFKSTRAEKGVFQQQAPTDFMDDEDIGEFGFAPQRIQTKEDFASAPGAAKRKFQKPSDGPIPGEPVLKNLLKPVHDKAAVRILKKMGWRDNQGIGSRQTYREKKMTNERNKRELYIQHKYGCDMGPMGSGKTQAESSEEESDLSDNEEITFAPDDFDPYVAQIKENAFGLGYSGLQPTISSNQRDQHINLFQVVDRNNKKLSIMGQAFGIGALEDDDDLDVFAPDDMSKYDRSLDDAKNKSKKPKAITWVDSSIIEGFAKTSLNESQARVFSVDVPRSFVPRNWLTRRSRFEPLEENRAKVLAEQNKHKVLGLGRHDLKPEDRGDLLNDEPQLPQKPIPEQSKVRQETDEEKEKRKQESARRLEELLNSKQFVSEQKDKFKPFITNPEKQIRYEKFLELKTSNESEIEKFLNDLQPLSMSSFDREMEKKEFIQAKRMYQPLDSLMANRFIKEVDVHKEKPEVKTKKLDNGNEVIVIQRTKEMWKPHKNLCKRFNVPEPFSGNMFDEEEEKKRKKKSSSLFDYIGVPINKKSDFIAPQVIPRKLVVDDRKKNADEEQRKSFLAAVEKEKSFMHMDQTKRAAAKDFFDISEQPASKANTSTEPMKAVQIVPPPPRTELEQKVADSIDKKPEEKRDLFKAIFCDSDDDNDEPDAMEAEELSQSLLSDKQKSNFIESFLSTKSAGEINVLRNSSPPRGLFKNILEVNTSVEASKIADAEQSSKDDFYGPKLPDRPLVVTIANPNDDDSSPESSLDEEIVKKLKKVKKSMRHNDADDVWVEKEKLSKKKHKKEKHKHKKHKSRK